MHIMEIVSGTEVSGVTAHCALLAKELIRRGHRITLVCRKNAPIADRLRSEPIEIVDSDLHRFPTDQLRRVAKFIAAQGVDVVHTHQSRAHFFGVLLRWFSGVPCVATAHSRHFQLHWMFNDFVIATSQAARRYHSRCNLVSSRRIEVVHNFIDTRPFDNTDPQSRRHVRQSLGLDGDVPLLGVIGRITPGKGIAHLIGALPRITEECPDARLVVVGSGENDHLSQLRALAARLNVTSAVVWAGYRDDVPEVLSALDVCVLPSLEESFPLTLLEAMAAGLPVVASDVGGVPECVVPGETGTLVPPGDSDSLAEAIAGLLKDPELGHRFGHSGRARVKEHFSLEGQTARIEAVLSRLAAA